MTTTQQLSQALEPHAEKFAQWTIEAIRDLAKQGAALGLEGDDLAAAVSDALKDFMRSVTIDS